MSQIQIPIQDKELRDAPVFAEKFGAKNWFAKIERDDDSPGGVKRTFSNQVRDSRESFYKLPRWCKEGVAVEFGADVVTAAKKRLFNRWYGVVTSVSSDKLVISEAQSKDDALDGKVKTTQGNTSFSLESVSTDDLIRVLTKRGYKVFKKASNTSSK